MTNNTELQKEVAKQLKRIRNRKAYIKRRRESESRIQKMTTDKRKYDQHTKYMVKSLMDFNPMDPNNKIL